MPTCSRTLIWAMLLVGCSGSGHSDHPTDADTDADTLACMDRETFRAAYQDQMCAYSDTCPGGPIFETRDACLRNVSALLDNSSCWDDCLAKACAEWLATEPQCQDETGRMADACEEVYKCP